MVNFKVAKRRILIEIGKNKTSPEMIKTLRFYIKEFKEINKKTKAKRKGWMR